MESLFIVSITVSAVILLIFLLTPIIDKRYSAGWKYCVWLILSLRLLIPFRIELPDAPISLSVNDMGTFVLGDSTLPLEYFSDSSYTEKGDLAENSAYHAPLFTVRELIAALWLIGAIIFFGARIIGYFRFKHIALSSSIPEQDNIFICNKIKSPMMIGFLKPIILLPRSDYSDTERDVIIRHELTHWKRRDTWYKLLLTAVLSLHWFNPIIHFMTKKAARDLEYSCDELVIKGMDTEYKKQYAMTILKTMKGENIK